MDYATVRYGRFIKDLAEFNIRRCFLKLSLASLPLAPARLPGIGLSKERRGQRVILARDLPGTLCNRKLTQAGRDIAAETGLEHRPIADGKRVAGIYRRSIVLASGHDAMLDDGMASRWCRGSR